MASDSSVQGSTDGSRQARALASRRRILDAAARCFCEFGYQRTRFEDIAAGAGVSRALVYNYFSTKENLLRSACDRALLGWRAAVQSRIDAAEGAAAKLGALVRHTLVYARTRPLLQAILSDDGRVTGPGEATLGAQGQGEWRALLIELLTEGVGSGDLRPDLDIERTADVLRAMQLGVIDRMHGSGPVDVSTLEHVEAASALMVHGISASTSGA